MKKIGILATFVVALFTSCSESEYEFHQTYFTPQEPNLTILGQHQHILILALMRGSPLHLRNVISKQVSNLQACASIFKVQ